MDTYLLVANVLTLAFGFRGAATVGRVTGLLDVGPAGGAPSAIEPSRCCCHLLQRLGLLSQNWT